MSRDQRVNDNYGLIYAQSIALNHKEPLVVVFNHVSDFLCFADRNFAFMLEGLISLKQHLQKLNITFKLLSGKPSQTIFELCKKIGAGALVTDFSPLKISRTWKKDLTDLLDISFTVVDAHNIVPCAVASNKAEYGAYTIRPKINRLLSEYLTEIPKLIRHPFDLNKDLKSKFDSSIDMLLKKYSKHGFRFVSGEKEALKALKQFIDDKLERYDKDRNNPLLDGQSDLSPYIHFGQISAQRIALEVSKSITNSEACKSFLEELIVRRELSDNFCFYNSKYDSFEGFPDWAKKSLAKHKAHIREYLYSIEEFENALTHDKLWNAAQKEMVLTGKMHGYMRMYWAKKILEWTAEPEIALKNAIYLNDKYSIDGRDPNGYAGIAWSIGGVHDRAWGERPVFGKVRFMSYKGCKSKFDVIKYIEKINNM